MNTEDVRLSRWAMSFSRTYTEKAILSVSLKLPGALPQIARFVFADMFSEPLYRTAWRVLLATEGKESLARIQAFRRIYRDSDFENWFEDLLFAAPVCGIGQHVAALLEFQAKERLAAALRATLNVLGLPKSTTKEAITLLREATA